MQCYHIACIIRWSTCWNNHIQEFWGDSCTADGIDKVCNQILLQSFLEIFDSRTKTDWQTDQTFDILQALQLVWLNSQQQLLSETCKWSVTTQWSCTYQFMQKKRKWAWACWWPQYSETSITRPAFQWLSSYATVLSALTNDPQVIWDGMNKSAWHIMQQRIHTSVLLIDPRVECVAQVQIMTQPCSMTLFHDDP